MSGIRSKAVLASAVLVGNIMLMTACQSSDQAAVKTDAKPVAKVEPAQPAEPATERIGTPVTPPVPAQAPTGKGTTAKDTGAKTKENKGGKSGKSANGAKVRDGSGYDIGDGRRVPVEQTCGANDINWKTRAESQAGGYILLMAKAKPGITCYLPAALPTVAFGSDGTEAGPAQKAAPKQIKLSGNKVAYAGVNPKTTKGNWGKQFDSIIVAVGNDDPNPESLRVGTITVDKPVVTNWQTKASDAVPLA
ncbi:hypothetical protein ACWDR0_02900 [Streptomyces sp. NPDC003691]